jgi:hypothetical protein
MRGHPVSAYCVLPGAVLFSFFLFPFEVFCTLLPFPRTVRCSFLLSLALAVFTRHAQLSTPRNKKIEASMTLSQLNLLRGH